MSNAPRRRQKLSPEEKEHIRALLAALELFREIRSTMPLQYVIAYLRVALEEGKGVTEYGKEVGVSQAVMSRHLLDIGDRNRYMTEGFGLITKRPDPMELRKLTEKGEALAHQVIRALRRMRA
jgi:DNA-binding MarR family transcriptional regulator